MLKIPTIILAFLIVCHYCLARSNYKPLMSAREMERDRLFREHQMRMRQERYRLANLPNSELRYVTVDAALAKIAGGYKYVYLFIGNRVQVLRDRKFQSEMSKKSFHISDDMHLQAAFTTPETQEKRIFYGDEYGKFVSIIEDVKKKRLKYGPARAFIRDGGPDAAGRRAGKVYVFKGCQVAVRKSWKDWGKPVNVTTIGLPCDVDAAWNEDGDMVVLKGDEIWRWNENDSVEGPFSFATLYTLKRGYALKPEKKEKPTTQSPIDYNASVQGPEGGVSDERPSRVPIERPSRRHNVRYTPDGQVVYL